MRKRLRSRACGPSFVSLAKRPFVRDRARREVVRLAGGGGRVGSFAPGLAEAFAIREGVSFGSRELLSTAQRGVVDWLSRSSRVRLAHSRAPLALGRARVVRCNLDSDANRILADDTGIMGTAQSTSGIECSRDFRAGTQVVRVGFVPLRPDCSDMADESASSRRASLAQSINRPNKPDCR